MKPIYKIFLFFFLNFSMSFSAFSQNSTEKISINESISYANSLIWNVNNNLKSLRDFQNQMIIWAENPSRQMNNKPEYHFIHFIGEQKIISQDIASGDELFNYHYQLNKIDQQIKALNLTYKRIENLKYSFNTLSEEKRALKELHDLIGLVQKRTLDLADTSYDFSRACAINFKAKSYPTQLAKIKNVVSQSKNLILAIRNNDKQLSKEYLELLTKATELMEKTTNVRELYVLSKSSSSLEEIHGLIIGIYQKAFNIASWGEMYLQSSFSENEVNLLLQEAISEFNAVDGDIGCASAFNKILLHGKDELMFYSEEPNSIIAEDIVPSVRINSLKPKEEIKKTLPAVEEKPNIIVEPEIVEPIVVLEKEKDPVEVEKINVVEEQFDESNLNSLAGSLPNNLIILLDVSVSMKKSGKLPILKKSISHFLSIMREEDKISLISYSGETKVLVSGASKQDRFAILDTLSKVKSSGGSDVYNALKEAYRIGGNNFIENGNNKIIIASDGIFGVDYSTLNFVKEKTLENFTLSVFQYSNEDEQTNYKSLKNLATAGKGNYRLIYNNDEAIKAMINEIKKQAITN